MADVCYFLEIGVLNCHFRLKLFLFLSKCYLVAILKERAALDLFLTLDFVFGLFA